MTETMLVKLFEHNNWANREIIQACSALSDEQLDAEPQSATKGSIRRTLAHLVASQQGYLSLLTLPVEARRDAAPAFAELQQAASISGEGLLALAKDEPSNHLKNQLRTTDGYLVEPWVVLVQVINHAEEILLQCRRMCYTLSGLATPSPSGPAAYRISADHARIVCLPL
jgi:uncharacterized damage-inducible protein DinB